MNEICGYLLDVYPDPVQGDLSVWLLADNGDRLQLHQQFPLSFYAAGPDKRLRCLWEFLRRRFPEVDLSRTERRDLFIPRPITVLEVGVAKAIQQPRIFHDAAEGFPDLQFYNADVPLLPRYAALFDVFPLTHCQVQTDSNGWIKRIQPLESRWALDPEAASLRILTIQPDCDPFHAESTHLHFQYGRFDCRLPFQPARAFLAGVGSILRQYDPDLILTDWGDTWMLPLLIKLSEGRSDLLPLNRDPDRPAQIKKARVYQSYGQVIYRGLQVHLHGRIHIDRKNAMLFSDCGLDGICELARVSGLPLQVAARNSPGAGITAMQMITALRSDILIPYHQQQVEKFKTAQELIETDKGGLIAAPLLGVFPDVAEIDFIGMYPSIIRTFNLSPETLTGSVDDSRRVPGVSLRFQTGQPGILPATISPLLDKRIAIKHTLSGLDARDCRYAAYKARSAAIKWLLVVAFGYSGFRNAKFGRIESHQAITAYARDVILRAKEAAESLGFEVLHMYIDCLWIRKTGASQVSDFQPVLDKIVDDTGLPISLDGIYKWVTFLPSRMNSAVGVSNRYFGVFKSSEIKVRGIEARRRNTPGFVTQTQLEIVKLMARADTAAQFSALLPEIISLLRKQIKELKEGRVPIEQLLVRQRITRSTSAYRSPSPAARAAILIERTGKCVDAGQSVQFVYAMGKPGVISWDLPGEIDPRRIDVPRYIHLVCLAAETVLQPAGVGGEEIRHWLAGSPILAQPPLVWTLPSRLPLASLALPAEIG